MRLFKDDQVCEFFHRLDFYDFFTTLHLGIFKAIVDSSQLLKALTDHFRGGSRVALFDPYS